LISPQIASFLEFARRQFCNSSLNVADKTARVWLLDPIILMQPGEPRDYVCRERLIGAQSFTDVEMQNPSSVAVMTCATHAPAPGHSVSSITLLPQGIFGAALAALRQGRSITDGIPPNVTHTRWMLKALWARTRMYCRDLPSPLLSGIEFFDRRIPTPL